MGFTQDAYYYDRDNEYHEAGLRDGAYLYRVTSLSHCSESDILTGRGPLLSKEKGRFNAPQQQTTYCANNVLVCIAEVLFHMYRKAVERVGDEREYALVRRSIELERCLVIFKVKEIKDLVHLDSEGVALDFSAGRTRGTAAVFPDEKYDLFQEIHNVLREKNRKGILYPSARHSRDICVALFDDETEKIARDGSEILAVSLRLIPENQEFSKPLRKCNPFIDKLHPTMGYYRFANPGKLEDLCQAGVLNPSRIPPSGLVDFVRRQYTTYPEKAICAVG